MKWEIDLLFFGTSWRKKRAARKRRKSGGLFRPARHKWIADIITFESPEAARAAARKLVTYVRTGYNGRLRIGQKRALEILRALNYAANRAEAAAKNPKLKPGKKRELREIAAIYRDAAGQVQKTYARRYGE